MTGGPHDRIVALAAAGRSKEPVIKWIDQGYVTKAGIDTAIQAEGFKTAWCNDDQLARRTDLEGWEVAVIELDGQNVMLKRKDPVVGATTLIKKRVKDKLSSGRKRR